MSRIRDQRGKCTPRRLCAGLLIAGITLLAALPPVRATIQEESCIYPDVEYPMPCDDDD